MLKKENYYKENAWWASPYNDEPEVRDGMAIADKVEIHDATLRDGEQTPGVVFSVDDKIRIAEMLSEAGVERIEAGMPAVSKVDYEAVKKISRLNLPSKIFVFSRAMEIDINMAVESGAQGVVIEVPIGYPKLKHQFHWTWEDVLEKSIASINYAKKQGLYTVYFPYDTTRARYEDLVNLMDGIMKYSPPDSVGVVDTVGCALPETIKYLVRKMKKLTGGLPIEVHTHNDFGMGVATEIAGVAAGAEVIHSCVNGLGERTGNAATEELMVALKIMMGINHHYKLDKLMDLCKMVEEISGVKLAENKPISGARNYVRESGIGIDLVLKNPLAMFATDPKHFGRTGEIVLGKKSGKASVDYFLDKLNIQVSEQAIDGILDQVKKMGTEKKGLVTLEEFQHIVEEYK
ncbi:MAG: 2-isopropylmalate synthase [Eubacteriales bacterium]|nr:2-isopropylmalate synthase [Eubacteriales bacterium]